MNFKLVFRITGKTLLVEAGAMLLPLAVGFLYGEDPAPFLYTLPLLVLVGAIFSVL